MGFEIDGFSMPPAGPGWVIVFRRKALPPQDLVGAPCMVKLTDGLRYFKRLRRGYAAGKWNLESWDGSPLIEDVEISEALAFAALVPGRVGPEISPRSFAFLCLRTAKLRGMMTLSKRRGHMQPLQIPPDPALTELPSSLIRDRATASHDYAGNPHRFEGVTAQDLDHDEAALNAVASASLALLACARARIGGAC